MKLLRACSVVTAIAAASGSAWAHSGTGLEGGFASGFLHPLSGYDHLLAMVAVGLWGAFLGSPLIVALPVIFPTVMALGGVLAMLGVPIPPVEIGIAVSVLLLGTAIAAGYRAKIWVACGVVAIFGVFHGYAHGLELPSAADPVGYSVGFVTSTGLLHVAGIAIGMVAAFNWGRVVVRMIGGGIGVAGVYFLWGAVAG